MRKFKYLLLGLAFALIVGMLGLYRAFPSIDPSVWRLYVEATGMWDATAFTPVLGRALVSLGCQPSMISVVAVGLLAFAVFDLLWRMLVLMVCPHDNYRNWWRMTIPVLALLGGILVVFSEPVWRMALSGSSVLLTLALLVFACDLFLIPFFVPVILDEDGVPIGRLRSNCSAYAAFLLSGGLAVETPVAIVLPALFAVIHRIVFPLIMDDRYRDHSEELSIFAPIRFSNWIAFFFWLAGVAMVFSVSKLSTSGDILRYVVEVVRDIQSAATMLGWVLWIGCTLVPFALACGLLPVLTARDKWLEFRMGIVALLVAAVALVAISPLARGDWALIASAVVRSPLMQSLGAVLSAQAVVLSLAIFVYFAFHVMPRDYPLRVLAISGVGLSVAVVVATAVVGIRRESSRQIRQVIAEVMEETVREANGMKWIFTDGSADAGIELIARRHHQELKVCPLITGGALAAPTNSVALLRDWLAEGSSNLQASAVQIGFNLWKYENKSMPAASGLIARSDWPKGERERGILITEQLGKRMVELSRQGVLDDEVEPSVRDVFTAILWRLSRMARQRGDTASAEELENANSAARQMMEKVKYERALAFMQLTDSEGLQLALRRADFVEARRYAASVLKRAPDDVAANFGMGMSYLLEKKPKEAILYLERAHKAKPTEPAILNNLAIACLQNDDIAHAEVWAKKAIERAPDISNIRDTMQKIEKAKRK